MAKSLADTLIEEVEAFLLRTSMPHTSFGKLYNGDPSFVTRLRRGRKVRIDTIDGVRTFMAEYKVIRPRRRARGNEPRAAA